MDYEAVLVALDVGTSKVVALVGEVAPDGTVSIIGKGVEPSTGMRKGQVNNIEATVGSIRSAIDAAEKLSGMRLEAAFVGVGGAHVESQNSNGMVVVSGQGREVSREDIDRVTDVARSVQIPSSREILHVLARDFTVDGQEGVRDPTGMIALRLQVDTHIITGSSPALQNLSKCVRSAQVRVDELVAGGIASAEAVLTETERDLGVVVADIGAGTTDIVLYMDGEPFHTKVLPLGGANVTNDVAIGLKTSLAAAEQLKIRAGTADTRAIDPEEPLPEEFAELLEGRLATRYELAYCIEERMREIFEQIAAVIAEGGRPRLPAGVVLTGGGALLSGVADLGREVIGMPVRVGSPYGVYGIADELLVPQYSTAIGLLKWASRVAAGGEPTHYPTAPLGGALDRVRGFIKTLFP